MHGRLPMNLGQREHTHHGAMHFTALARARSNPAQQSNYKQDLVELFDALMHENAESRRAESCTSVATITAPKRKSRSLLRRFCCWCGGVPVSPDPGSKADDSIKAGNAVPYFDETHSLDFRLAYAGDRTEHAAAGSAAVRALHSAILVDLRPTLRERGRPWSIHGASAFASYAAAYAKLEQSEALKPIAWPREPWREHRPPLSRGGRRSLT
jgi:hypothetical protein